MGRTPDSRNLSGYEMLLVIAAHAQRHTNQIEEAKSILRGHAQPA